jgi:hypothetical protein
MLRVQFHLTIGRDELCYPLRLVDNAGPPGALQPILGAADAHDLALRCVGRSDRRARGILLAGWTGGIPDDSLQTVASDRGP